MVYQIFEFLVSLGGVVRNDVVVFEEHRVAVRVVKVINVNDLKIDKNDLQEQHNYYLAINFRFIVVYEDYWFSKKLVIKSRVLAALGQSDRIFARKTKVKRISITLLNSFLEQHHLNNTTKAKFKYGLFYENDLVSVASFSNARKIIRNGVSFRSYELIRTCNKSGLIIVGGLSKLINAFIKEQQPDDIMTYVDKDWSLGSAYIKLGFEEIGEIPPIKFLFDTNTNLRFPASRCKNLIINSFSEYGSFKSNSKRYKTCFNLGSKKFLLLLK